SPVCCSVMSSREVVLTWSVPEGYRPPISLIMRSLPMANNPDTPSPGGTTKGLLFDATEKWAAEAGCVPASLAEIRLDQNERLVAPFTTSVVEAVVHYLDYPSLRGYVRCNGPDCLLCKIGRQPDTRDLLPVYDVVSRAVGVLAVSPNLRPAA